MIYILTDHVLDIINRDILPLISSDMLPSGYLGKHQKSKFITLIKNGAKMAAKEGAKALEKAIDDMFK